MDLQAFAWIGFAAFFVASLVCGVRLVALWHRNRELPELLIGLGVLGIGPVGFGFITIGQLVGAGRPGAAAVFLGLGVVATAGGIFAKSVFNYTVYHADSRVVGGIVGLVGVVLVVCIVWPFAYGFDTLNELNAVYVARAGAQIGCLLWGAAEALRYWRIMRKRLAIGLTDPVVTNRFLLWGIGAGAAGLGTAVGFGAQLSLGRPPLEVPWVTLSSSLHGLVAAVAMWLAFLPSAAYRRYVLDRAARVSQPR